MRKIIAVILFTTTVIGIVCLIILNNRPLAVTIDSIKDPSEDSGYIPEKVIGNPDKADVIVYEYADYACPHCSDYNKKLNNLIEEFGEKIAIVFRGYNIGFQNGLAAAKAATAAQLQGFFKQYKDLLFNNQSEWVYEDGPGANALFIEYFKEASKNTGDIDKFKEDMKSNSVIKRLKYEQEIGNQANLTGTPMFRIDGKMIPLEELEETIRQKIK